MQVRICLYSNTEARESEVTSSCTPDHVVDRPAVRKHWLVGSGTHSVIKARDRRELHPVTLRRVQHWGWCGSSHSKPWRALNTGPEVRGDGLGRQEWKANIMHHCLQWACWLQKHGKHSYAVYLGTCVIAWNETITNSWKAKNCLDMRHCHSMSIHKHRVCSCLSAFSHKLIFRSMRLVLLLLPFKWNKIMYKGKKNS